jgi:hypothetical protein
MIDEEAERQRDYEDELRSRLSKADLLKNEEWDWCGFMPMYDCAL